jgi:hypothetical protein
MWSSVDHRLLLTLAAAQPLLQHVADLLIPARMSVFQLQQIAGDALPERPGPAPQMSGVKQAPRRDSRPATWRGWVEESFDPAAVVLAGGVLAVCVGSLLVLGGAAWTRSRSS